MKPIHSLSDQNGIRIELIARDHSISEVLEVFECVLKGAGYCFDGKLAIVNDTD